LLCFKKESKKQFTEFVKFAIKVIVLIALLRQEHDIKAKYSEIQL